MKVAGTSRMVRIAWCRVKLLPSIVLSLVLLGCGDLWMQKKPVLPVVQSLDLERYLGKWYEIARYPNSFQKGCVATTANYSMLEEGEIRVLNECRQGSLDGPAKRAEARAWVVDPSTKAKLKVQFFWPFRGDYWVIDLGPDYEYAVVGHPSRKYLWILSRTPDMPTVLYEEIVGRLAHLGYDPGGLVRTLQPGP